MKIGITLNEVLRDFIGQFAYTYDKYMGETINIKDTPIDSFELIDHFPFDDVDALNKFLYSEAALEIFGHADQIEENVFNTLNLFLMDMKDEGDHTVEIVSREAMSSIPSTLFFLSKVLCKIENLRFIQKYEDKWDGVDVLITANPKALESKPDGKISVKVNASYNNDIKADFEIDSITDFMKDEELRDRILNTKTADFEEVD